MYQDEKQKLVANLVWFNQFFQDLGNLLDRMGQLAGPIIGALESNYYYWKSNNRPSIPDYLLMGMSGEAHTLQIYAVLNPDVLQRDVFQKEPSFVVVLYDRPGRALYINDYGLRILSLSTAIKITQQTSYLAGQLVGKEPDGVRFLAFQVALDPFIGASDVDRVIQQEVVEPMRELPELVSGA